MGREFVAGCQTAGPNEVQEHVEELPLPINSHVYFPVALTNPSLEQEEQQKEQVEVATLEEQLPAPAPDAKAPAPAPAPASVPQTRAAFLKRKVIENFLPLGFGVALIIAMSVPAPGKQAASIVLPNINVLLIQAINNVIVFFISGITLNVNALAEIRSSWRAVVFGILAILFITPLLGFIFVNIPLEPKEFSIGLALFCCVPTTLGVGVALTTAAGGNNSVALFLTVFTNIIGILTVPYLLQFVLIQNAEASKILAFNPISVFVKLIFTVLIPSLLGVTVNRNSSRARAFVASRRTELSMFSTLNLVCIIWQTLSSASSILIQQSAVDLVLVVVISASLHLVMLGILFFITSRILRLPIKEVVAVTIMASQKSAPVAVTLISYITTVASTQGLLAIPALIGQLGQIFIGSALIARFRRIIKEAEAAAEAAGGGG